MLLRFVGKLISLIIKIIFKKIVFKIMKVSYKLLFKW